MTGWQQRCNLCYSQRPTKPRHTKNKQQPCKRIQNVQRQQQHERQTTTMVLENTQATELHSNTTQLTQAWLRWVTDSTTNSGERESRPFHEEPDTRLYFNQLYSSALGHFCHALSTAGPPTATGQESSTGWSLTILRRKRLRQSASNAQHHAMFTTVNIECG